MGSVLSSVMGGAAVGGGSEDSEESRVTSYHSAARWQLYLNSIKENPSKLLVIDFSASWCGPCKMMEPVYHDMASRFTDVDFAKIDVDELSEVSQQFGVQGMPTFVLLKNGKEVDRVVGAKKDELERKVEKNRS
ncbi:thioredoxin H2 [Argentina anserina]|uniref:thioredoxin H2 n=1 Tax=Argentina anserina TaxID=57926 RepID=UPI002176521A|nr:thioredoxin H2 [Potentilla anserina]